MPAIHRRKLLGWKDKASRDAASDMLQNSPMFMRIRHDSCILGLVASLSFAGLPALADLEVTSSVQIRAKVEFEAPLAVHGTWVSVGSHGRCWRPAHVKVGWRPYVHGEWVWTDCGWYWSSDEPWAWACYHYGAWVHDGSLGWIWVPHTKWAPAWVSWRVGGGYVGWAPLPPSGVVFARHPHSESFVFVVEGKFGGPVRPGLLVANNSKLIAKTTVVGGLKLESRAFSNSGSRKVMINHGPSVAVVQKASGRKFAAVPIGQAVSRTAGPKDSKYTSANGGGGREKAIADGKTEHGQDRADMAGKDGRGPGSGANSLASGGKDRGGRSRGGGGRGKH